MLNLKRIFSTLLVVSMMACMAVIPAFAENTKTLTLREDWRLTSDLDLNVPAGTTLLIDGQNKYHIYEMGGTLQKTGDGNYRLINNTILYKNDGTNSVLTISADKTSLTGGGTVTLTASDIANVVCDDTSIIPTKTSDGVASSDGTWTVNLPNETKTYTFTAIADSHTDAECKVTVTYKGSNSSSSGGGSSSGGSSSTGNKTETTTNPDGSTTTTVTKPDGTVTETTKQPDGSEQVVETAKDGTVTTTTTDNAGNKTEVIENTDGSSKTTVTNNDGSSSITSVSQNGQVEADVTLSAATVSNTAAGQAVSLPMAAVSVTANSNNAPTVTVNLPSNTSTKVEIPVDNATLETVAVLIKADGTEEIIKTSITTDDGIAVTLSDGDTVKIIDNSKSFNDVSDAYWGADAVAFASSREIFAGMSETTFEPETQMNRAMIVTVLARLDGVDTTGGATWYEVGQQWAINAGVSDGSNMDKNLTREQLASMLYRYVGEPSVSGDVNQFTDAANVSDYAKKAMAWAVQNGLISGMGNDILNPTGEATRVQVATILMNFIQNYS